MKNLYITDLDGTLLNNKAELSEKSEAFLTKAIDEGVLFTVATARTFATVTEMFKNVGLKLPLVLMNGVMLYDPLEKKIISYSSIDDKSIREVFELYKKHKVFPLVYRCKGEYLEIEYYNTDNPNLMKYIGNRVEAPGKKFVYSPTFPTTAKEQVIYIVTVDKYESILPLYEDIKKLDCVTCAFYRDNYTDCYFLEIFAKNVSKASALCQVKSIVGANRVIAFGDNLNDIEMFNEADEAYAVENAYDQAKKYATDIIGSNDNDSVASYIYYNARRYTNE